MAKWCDIGQHAYSGAELNAQTLSITKQVPNQWGGQQPSSITQDICSNCSAQMGLLSVDHELENVREENERRKALKAKA